MTRKMKDSGIEWIGEIPEEWSIVKLNKIANLITGNTPSKNDNNKYYSESGLMWVKPDNLNEFNYINYTNEFLNEEGEQLARIVPPFTPLVCCIGTIGKIGISNKRVAFNQQINAVEFDRNIYDWKFGMFYLMSQELQHWYYANGNVVKILNSANQGQINMVLPNINEQITISKYLENRCNKIDQTIEKEKQVIEKLKEYKQSVITEAVTKGLNPDVKMKDSGVEWIGEIPEHWEVGVIKYGTLKIGSGKTPKGGSEVYKDEGIIFIRSQNVYDEGLQLENCTYISDEIDEDMAGTRVYYNDVLLNITGGSIGRCCLYDIKTDHANVNQHVCIIRTNNDIILPKYMKYFWNSNVGKNSINIYQTGANREGLNFEQIGNTKIPYLSLEEQQRIADYLDKKCSTIDKLISKKEKVIEKLTEYKKSLIYECVTGKREIERE